MVAEIHATRADPKHELALGFLDKVLRQDLGLDAFQIESRPAILASAHTMRGVSLAALGQLDDAATAFEAVRCEQMWAQLTAYVCTHLVPTTILAEISIQRAAAQAASM